MGKLDPRLENIFAQAREVADGKERAAFVERTCGGDEGLRQEVTAMLRADKRAGNFMQATQVVGPANLIPSEAAGDRIGRYKLLEQIGEGGFGVVWMAGQEEPVRRRVALKIIKLGMDTKEVVARFEAERQALAMMDHPNIAIVFDGGATDTGRPYFVMELVKGVPITDYCDASQLSTHERLELFRQVCHAVQHAHQKGIIHRDLKPSNILVTVKDDRPVPKVIDFGVAKATQARLTEKTLFTRLQQWIGTPAYMSPEQAGLGSLDVDTRSDIYSLGVLLYELLIGRTPFDTQKLLAAGYDAVMRTIREEEPSKPSTRLSTLKAEELRQVATQRHVDPAKLERAVSGDLDWIVMKALEKDRRRRYETPDAFASDVARHLSNEPVLASPPSVPYLVAKFVRRHKAGLATASALVVLLAAGVVVSAWQAVRATRAERTQSSLRQQAEQAGVNESKQRQRADELRATAEDQARRIGHQLYASHMNLAFQVWERGDLTRVEQLLDEHRPQPGGEDLRGFEWFYLWRLCHSDQLTLRGHVSNVRGVAFSRDGRRLATAGDDSTARIWDAQTGKALFVLRGHLNGVTAVAFTPAGKILATGGGDQTVRLWDVATGEASAVLRGHKDGVSALAFSPDGRWLASATGRLANGGNLNPTDKFVDPTPLPGEVKVWNVEGRKATRTLVGHTGSILSLAFSPDGKTLVTGSTDATVKLWNVVTGTVVTNLTGFNGPVTAVAVSPDGQNLAIGGGDPYQLRAVLQVWDLVARKPKMTFKAHDGPVFAVAFAPDGKTLASGGLAQIVRFWDLATGEEVRNLKAHQASIWAIAYDASGKRFATASWDQTAKVWEAERPQGMEVFPNLGGYSGCFSSDGRYLIRGGTRLEVIEVGATNAPLLIPDYRNSDVVIAVSPGGSILASAGTDQMVTLWEVGTWRRLARLEAHTDKVWQLAFSPDGRTLASSDAEVLRLWDVARRVERVAVRPATDGIGRLLFTPDERLLIVSGARRTVFLEATTGREIRVLADTTWCPAISPDGRYLLGGSPAGLKLIDLKTMAVKWGINPHRATTWEVNFSPDGRTLATASWDGTAKLWNVASGQEMFTYKVPAVAWSTTFSPDGSWWAVGSGSARQSEVALFRRATLAEVDAADSPRILNQPASETVVPQGSSVTLGVTTVGRSPLFYQWRLGAEELPGQTNATLTLTHVTEASMGDYRVVVTNASGSATSSNASLTVMQVREAPIFEINFEERQPAATYSAFTWSENPAALSTNIIIGPGLGAGGSAGLVMTADGSGFTTNVSQRWAGFGVTVMAFAGRTNGVTTTNLSLYQVSATIKTTGLTGTNSHGRIQWQFLTPGGISLGRDFPATFTTNYQVYSMVLGEGSVDSNCPVPWSEFVAGFDQINRVQCAVVADHWLPEYGPDADNALYVDNLKFARLVPVPASLPINEANQNAIPQLRPTPPPKP